MVYKRYKNSTIMKLLNILGNETRLRILQMLAHEPMYVSEIAKTLAVGQQAVIRHLQELEEMGLITSYRGESNRGPDRKYYQIQRSIKLEVAISPTQVDIRAKDLKKKVSTLTDINDRIADMVNTLKIIDNLEQDSTYTAEELDNLRTKLNDALSLLRFLQIKIENLIKKVDGLKKKE